MPHIEIKYSNDLDLDCPAIFSAIENSIGEFDSTAGGCKGRAYPAAEYHHSHVFVSLMLLSKPHRDAAFSKQLTDRVLKAIRGNISFKCYLSLKLSYRDGNYVAMEI